MTDQGKELAQIIKRENKYSNQMALNGLSKIEKDDLENLLQVVEENVSENWNFVKNGGKRNY